jgi:hypothetical protein
MSRVHQLQVHERRHHHSVDPRGQSKSSLRSSSVSAQRSTIAPLIVQSSSVVWSVCSGHDIHMRTRFVRYCRAASSHRDDESEIFVIKSIERIQLRGGERQSDQDLQCAKKVKRRLAEQR